MNERPCSVNVWCRGEQHTVSLRRGGLALDDHPDVAAERILVALGGESPNCLSYHRAWREGLTDESFLELWAPQERFDPVKQAHLRQDREGAWWIDWPREPPAASALFPQCLQDGLAVAAIRRRLRHGDLSPAIEQAVTVRIRSAFRASLHSLTAHTKPDALVPFNVTYSPSASPSVRGALRGRDSWAEVTVDAHWLLDVWARGLAVVNERLVLADHEGVLQTLEWVPAAGDGLVASLALMARPRE